MRNFSSPSRSNIFGSQAAIATSHPVATQVGMNILENGGNSVDACIAAVAVLGIAEPAMTGIGGDCFALLAGPGIAPLAINGSGFSPASATLESALQQGLDAINTHSHWAVTVPGAIAAWHQLHEDFGQLPWAEILQPAIHYARTGIIVHERVAFDWQANLDTLTHCAATQATFLQSGQAYQYGENFALPKLADALEIIAKHGTDGFYLGDIAADIVTSLQTHGGSHTMADFAHMGAQKKALYIKPVRSRFHDWDIWECPPNGQGITAQMILAIMAMFDVKNLSVVDYHHLLAEATKQAMQARDNCITDVNFMHYSSQQLLDARFIAKLAANIDMAIAVTTPRSCFPDHTDTVYLCCVDQQGLNVSFINSIFNSFGCGITSSEYQILLQSRGTSFSLDPTHVNKLAPRKRPLHTIIPGLITQGDNIIGPFGVMGGQYQACGHAHLISQMINFQLDPQQAIEQPRSFAYANKLSVEATLSAEAIQGLQSKGHQVEVSAGPIGGGQCIIKQPNGNLCAASDHRKDGMALAI